MLNFHVYFSNLSFISRIGDTLRQIDAQLWRWKNESLEIEIRRNVVGIIVKPGRTSLQKMLLNYTLFF
jgi:hypothetical protein